MPVIPDKFVPDIARVKRATRVADCASWREFHQTLNCQLETGNEKVTRFLDNRSTRLLRYEQVHRVKNQWRVEDSWIAVERSPGIGRELDDSFADEVAIDFPAVSDKIERMRHAFDRDGDSVDRTAARRNHAVAASGWSGRGGAARSAAALDLPQTAAAAAKCGAIRAPRARAADMPFAAGC